MSVFFTLKRNESVSKLGTRRFFLIRVDFFLYITDTQVAH